VRQLIHLAITPDRSKWPLAFWWFAGISGKEVTFRPAFGSFSASQPRAPG
jgi:hypothetical protein